MAKLYRFTLVAALLLRFTFESALADHKHGHGEDHRNDAEEQRREGAAHVHGAWELFAALDDKRLSVTTKGPLVDILGFERAPQTDDQRRAITALSNRLAEPAIFLALSERARCVLAEPASVKLPENFDAEASSDHSHDLEDEAHNSHHADHHDAQADHSDEDTHESDIEISYVFECAAPKRLREITMTAFNSFSDIETIEAVFLSDQKQIALQLTRGSKALRVD